MSFAALIFFCLIILSATHVLDALLVFSDIKKSHFLLMLAVCFGCSVMPTYNINRYISLNALFILSLVGYVVMVARQKEKGQLVRELFVILSAMVLYVLQLVWELLFNNTDFYYAAVLGLMLYCVLTVKKPFHCAVSVFFGIWLLQLLSIGRNMIIDAYVYFNFASDEVMQTALITAFCSFAFSNIFKFFRQRKNKRRINHNPLDLAGQEKFK